MIDKVEKFGEYFFLSEEILFCHEKNSKNTIKNGVSFVLLENSTKIKDKKIKLLIVLSTIHEEEHLTALLQLKILAKEKGLLEKLNKEKNSKKIMEIIEKMID